MLIYELPLLDLPEETPLFVAKLSDDLIGLSTVRIGLGTPGEGKDPEDIFVGAAASTKEQGLVYFTGIGTGEYHSLKRSYDETVKGSIEKNKVTVSTASSHGLKHNDRVFLTVNAGIVTTVPIKYNKANRKLIARTLDFTLHLVLTHQLHNLEFLIQLKSLTMRCKLAKELFIHQTSPMGGLVNDEEYFVYVINKDKIKLCGSRFQTRQRRPKFVGILTC